MDHTARFAAFTAVGLAAFAAGLSLTTACHRAEPQKEQAAETRPAPAKETKAPAAKEEGESVEAPAAAPASVPAAPAATTPVTAPKVATKDGEGVSSGLSVRRLVVTHAVAEREPVSPAELVVGTPIVAFVELANSGSEPGAVTVTFERDGQPPVGHVKLEVPGSMNRYRTWARSRNLGEPGTWQAVVHGPDGSELGRMPFELSAAGG